MRRLRSLLTLLFGVLLAACAAEVAPRASVEPIDRATWLSSSVFRTGWGWFQPNEPGRVFTGDTDGDRRDDVFGLDDNGGLWIAPNVDGQRFEAPLGVTLWTGLSRWNGWLTDGRHPRILAGDVTGDGRVDLVAVELDGGLWIVESSSSGYCPTRMLHASSVMTTGPFFQGPHAREWLADVSGDGVADVVTIDGAGRVAVAGAMWTAGVPAGSCGRAGFTTPAIVGTTSATSALDDTTAPRLVLADVGGDAGADVVYVEADGTVRAHLFAGLSLGAQRTLITRSVLVSALFPASGPTRVLWGDVDGDGRTDAVAVRDMPDGDGPWRGAVYLLSPGVDALGAPILGSSIALHDSSFDADGAQGVTTTTGTRSRLWLEDATGDGTLDLVAIDARGDAWISDGLVERSSADAAPGHDATRVSFRATQRMPARLPIGDVAFYRRDIAPRLFWANVDALGGRELVSISPGAAGTADGDIDVHALVPTTLRVVDGVSPAERTAGFVELRLEATHALDPSVPPGAVTLRVGGATMSPSVTVSGNVMTVSAAAAPGPMEVVELVVDGAELRDAWGRALDGDGDHVRTPDDRHVHVAVTRGGLHAGSARRSLEPELPVTDLRSYSGFGLCRNPTPITAASPMPPQLRVVVLAAPHGPDPYEQSESDVTVLVSLDSVGVNAAGIAARLEGALGLDPRAIIVGATHGHATVRSARIFESPFFDEHTRELVSADTDYATWTELVALDAVREALAELRPADLAATQFPVAPHLQYDRVAPTTGADPVTDPRMGLLHVTERRSTQLIGTVVSYALHPVYVGPSEHVGLHSDFPGYLTRRLELNEGCATRDCVAMYFNSGAGNLEPHPGTFTVAHAESTGETLATAAMSLAAPVISGETVQLAPTRTWTRTPGLIDRCDISGCAPHYPSAADRQAATWTLPASLLRVREGAAPRLAIGALPGEPVAGIQRAFEHETSLRGWPLQFFWGYTSAYVGYLTDTATLSRYVSVAPPRYGYGVTMCWGPVFFSPEHLSGPLAGEALADGLVQSL